MLVAMLLLLFPTGRFASRRWRLVALTLAALLAVSLLQPLHRCRPRVRPGKRSQPVGGSGDREPSGCTGAPGFLLFGTLLLLSAASVLLRFRRADDDVRAQLLWFVLGAAAIALVFTLDGVMQVAIPHPGPALATLSTACEGLAFSALAASIAMAMLRNRLFDIDRLTMQTFGYGMLAVVATAGYLVVVAVTGAVLTAAGFADVIAPFAAAAVIAVAVHPLRLGLLRLGEHLVLGRARRPIRSSPAPSARWPAHCPPTTRCPPWRPRWRVPQQASPGSGCAPAAGRCWPPPPRTRRPVGREPRAASGSRAAGRRGARSPHDRARLAFERGGTTARGRSGFQAGIVLATPFLQPSCSIVSTSCGAPRLASPRPRRRSGGGSSATCTTASSSSSRP